ncbi:hypothetical protein FB45DRAFT_888277 [Roridomyces roridus]|uniref:Uncharacterized protein n=1 Tax=Roridomyces roridus TaxID=1738132 RepID=A0AAD7FYR7_9AGAR|nr:hypothetical protein FB45DRAFT_888277 [Roridomyces roridus]
MGLVSVLLLVLFTAVKLGGVLWMSRLLPGGKTYTFLGEDYPHLWSLEWPDNSRVLMPVHDTVRYQLDTEDGAAEWAASYPGNGLVYLGQQCRPFTTSMFHQIRCLDHIRTAAVDVHSNRTSNNVDSPLTLHCLNYLRQMALCRSHSYLDPILGYPIPNAHPDTDVCQDWSVVYRELHINQQRCSV